MEPRRTYAETPWGQVHYRASGSGDALLLLHSSSGSSRVFRRLMALMPDKYCVAPDLPGFGESAPMPAGARIEDLADQVVSFLDAIGVAKAHVFGLHSGNKVAAALAADRPDRVQRLVIAGMTHSLIVDGAQRNAAVLRYAGRDTAASGAAAGWQALCDKLGKMLSGPVPTDGTGAPDHARLADEALDLVQARAGADAMYPANLAFDLPGKLRQVRAPSLIVELATAGEADFGLQGPLLAGLMEDCRATVLAGPDRELLQARPAELAEVLRGFLGA